MLMSKICEHCHMSYTVHPYREEKSRFCSRTCKDAGRLTGHGMKVCKRGHERDARLTECKECKHISQRAWEMANPERAKDLRRNWAIKNPESRKKKYARNRAKNIEKSLERQAKNQEHVRGYQRRAIETMMPGYVAAKLHVSVCQLTPELLKLKREQLKISRATRKLKKVINESIKNTT